MMKHLLTIVLCLTTLTGLAQEEKIKKSEWWNGNPSYAVPIREVNVCLYTHLTLPTILLV